MYHLDKKCVLEELSLEHHGSDDNKATQSISEEKMEYLVSDYRTTREERSRVFLEQLKNKNQAFLDSLCSTVA